MLKSSIYNKIKTHRTKQRFNVVGQSLCVKAYIMTVWHHFDPKGNHVTTNREVVHSKHNSERPLCVSCLTSLSMTFWMVLYHSLIRESVSDCSRNSFPVTVLSYNTHIYKKACPSTSLSEISHVLSSSGLSLNLKLAPTLPLDLSNFPGKLRFAASSFSLRVTVVWQGDKCFPLSLPSQISRYMILCSTFYQLSHFPHCTCAHINTPNEIVFFLFVCFYFKFMLTSACVWGFSNDLLC